ncbi:hypothetical protein GCM10010289_70330 [Streptomyces violascens]|nr:hypothetical protein GCM10010289_70330 [Streptomyces violascens]
MCCPAALSSQCAVVGHGLSLMFQAFASWTVLLQKRAKDWRATHVPPLRGNWYSSELPRLRERPVGGAI